MRQLYTAVTILKMTYAIDVWLTLPRNGKEQRGAPDSVVMTNRLVSLQRSATLAITGAMRTTATNVLDLHTGLLPMRLALHRLCHWATLRIASLPEEHPLHDVSRNRAC